MIGSVNEIANLAAKAARGAGAPPAQAAQFGQATVHHLASERSAGELRAALQALPNGPIISLPSSLLDILENSSERFRRGLVYQNGSTGLTCSYIDALPFASSWDYSDEWVDLTIDTEKPAPRLTATRVALPDELAREWRDLAARTFVPETEASRLAGAGAGLTDND